MNYTVVINGDKNLNPEKPMLPISIIANLLGTTARTLRIYEENELLTPSRSAKNRRLYSINDLERAKLIQYLSKELKINVPGIILAFRMLAQTEINPNKYIEHIRTLMKDVDNIDKTID